MLPPKSFLDSGREMAGMTPEQRDAKFNEMSGGAYGQMRDRKKPAAATTPVAPAPTGSGGAGGFSQQTPEQRQALLQAMITRSRGGMGSGGVGGLA